LRPSSTTAVTTSSAVDMADLPAQGGVDYFARQLSNKS